MTNFKLMDQNGNQAGEVALNDNVFSVEPNEAVVFDAIIRQRAGKRQGTSKVRNRSAVRGGGKKPWRQKGTGVLVKALSVLHNGAAVVLSLGLLHVPTLTACQESNAGWLSSQFCPKRFWTKTW